MSNHANAMSKLLCSSTLKIYAFHVLLEQAFDQVLVLVSLKVVAACRTLSGI